jgi:hypothetical protein
MWNAQVLNRITRYHLVVVAAASALAFWLWPAGGLGLLLGGGFSALNFWSLSTLVQRTLLVAKNKRLYGLLLALRMIAGLGVIAALVLVLRVHPLAVALGLATTFVSILGAMLHTLILHKAPAA